MFPPDDLAHEPPPDDLPARVRAELADPARTGGPVHRVLRDLGWTPPPQPTPRQRPLEGLPETGDLLDLLAGGCSVHEAAEQLAVPVSRLRAELVALRRRHACSSTAEVVRRVHGGH